MDIRAHFARGTASLFPIGQSLRLTLNLIQKITETNEIHFCIYSPISTIFFFFFEAQRAEERDLRNHTADLGIQIRGGFMSQIKEFDFHLEALRHHQRVLNRR